MDLRRNRPHAKSEFAFVMMFPGNVLGEDNVFDIFDSFSDPF
jgi:hypothetical protein